MYKSSFKVIVPFIVSHDSLLRNSIEVKSLKNRTEDMKDWSHARAV